MADTFSQIPHSIQRRRDLSAGAKVVYAAIADRIGQNGKAWPGVRTVADDCGMSRSSAARFIDEVRAAGLLAVNSAGRGTRNTYAKSVPPAGQLGNRSVPPAGQKCPELGTECPELGTLVSRPRDITIPNNQTHEPDSITKPKRVREPKFDPVTFAEAELPMTSDLRCDRFRAAWKDWAEHRAGTKHPLSDKACRIQLRRLAEWGLDKAIESIERSISSGWRDVFPEKPGYAPKPEPEPYWKPIADKLAAERRAKETRTGT